MKKKILIMIGLSSIIGLMTPLNCLAEGEDLGGQTIKIHTNLHTFVGKPAWLLIIRDVDHNQNMPFLYDFTTGSNYWVAFTYGRNYEITVSEMVFNPYDRKIKDFCNLESMGAIQHGVGLDIYITGNLSPRGHSYSCHVMRYNSQDQ